MARIVKKYCLPVIIACVAIGVVAFLVTKFVGLINTSSRYVDRNGTDNYALEVIKEEDLPTDEYMMFKTNYSFEGGCTQVDDKELERVDQDFCSISAEIFDGVYTAQATKIEKDVLSMKLSSQVKAGNFEIFILIDDKADQCIQANCEKEIVLEGIKGRTVLVKIVGEGADFVFNVERSY